MLSFFKTKKRKDSTVEAEELLNQKLSNDNDSGEVRPKLSIHPLWNIPNEKKYVYSFLNQDLPPLKPNQLSLSTIDVSKEPGKVTVTAFIRNSLKTDFTLGQTDLLLLDENGKFIARKTFNLQELGKLPASSSRPWNFTFEVKDENAVELTQNAKLAFQLKAKHQLDLEPSWENTLPKEQKEKLVEYVKNLQPPKESEVNFAGLSAKLADDKLTITVLIRNGRNDHITISQLPVQVIDANNDLVAKGGFELNELTIKANTTKPWTFIFPKELILKENPDLSSWRFEVIQNN